MDAPAQGIAWVETPIAVRPACFEDAFGIRDTLLDALSAAETPYPRPDMPYAVQYIMDLIAQDLVAVAECAGRIVGCIVLSYARWPWVHPSNPAGIFLQNDHFWVEPTARRGGTAVKLLSFAKKKSDALKIWLSIDLSSLDASTEAKDRFVKSQGFVYIGGKFMRQPIPSS